MHLLEVKNLRTRFHTDAGVVNAVDGISYFVDEGEIVGLVGESGCGKSVSQLSVLQLIPVPPGEIAGGQAVMEGRDLLHFDPKGPEMREIRGGKISIIFQEPMTSLNPVLTVSRQLTEMMELHLKLDWKSSRSKAIDLLRMVGIPDPFVEESRGRIFLEGDVPSPVNPPPGCNFHPRCSRATGACKEVSPTLENVGREHRVACIRVGE